MNKVTWKDIGDHLKGKDHPVQKEIGSCYHQSRSNGRSSILLVCPFCKADVECFYWSYAAHGKRCDCGAMLGHSSAWHFKEMILF